MLLTLNGMFAPPKPYKINFVEENKRKIKEMKMVNQSSRSKLDVSKSKNSRSEIGRNISSATTFNENKNFSNSKCRLTSKGSMVVFMQEKKDKGSISSVSLSSKRRPSYKVVTTKNQSCQTIDPRKCDQLFHEGVIKYPSNKVLQELAEIEKQKANRLDIHVKKEFFTRNKIKLKSLKKKILVRENKLSGKGDIGENINAYGEGQYANNKKEENCKDEDEGDIDNDEDDDDDDDDVYDEDDYDEDDEDNGDENDENPQQQCDKTAERKSISVNAYKANKSPPPLTMCAAEIIRKTTENINSQKKHFNSFPNNKGDSKAIKNSQKLSKNDDILKTVLDPHCPPGHIPLPDVERKKTLHMLRVSHAELVREMNRLPVRTDTLRIRQKKLQLEAQLNKIEEGIKVFNKSKVYVKIEE